MLWAYGYGRTILPCLVVDVRFANSGIRQLFFCAFLVLPSSLPTYPLTWGWLGNALTNPAEMAKPTGAMLRIKTENSTSPCTMYLLFSRLCLRGFSRGLLPRYCEDIFNCQHGS